ncbi:MAG: MBL fold metallo-hydrolase [Oscillospiraceae bacterium]|nr:MBL fold metallo-hydrolase [Oscillospiraceae bacterium]
MKKTYATSLPDHIGAFLKASRCFAALGINITRVSYDKAVDAHMLFLDVEGTPNQLRMADAALERIGYLQNIGDESSIVLLQFDLHDKPGEANAVLKLIHDFNFNISYINAQGGETAMQQFRVGIYVEDQAKVTEFLEQAEQLCRVQVIEYNPSARAYDNSIFYSTFVRGVSRLLELTAAQKQNLLVYSNLAMQTLDQQGLLPYQTFDSIGKFAELLSRHRGAGFRPRITTHPITENTDILLIEPPCGSNTAVIRSGGSLLCIDSGYARYRQETLQILREQIPDFDTIPKRLLLTHADPDHCGLMEDFDEIICSPRSADDLIAQAQGEDCLREKNPLHRPYLYICKLLTGYRCVEPDKLRTPWPRIPELRAPLTQIGFFDFGDLNFEVYEGRGGHLPGEIVLIDYEHNIAFTGDVYINLKGLIEPQAEHNRYAPILMTSVDCDPRLCADERKAILRRLGAGDWKIFGAHGAPKEYSVK